MTYSIHFEKYYYFSYGDFEEKLDRFLKWPSEAHLLAKIFDDYPEPEPVVPPSFEEFKSFIDKDIEVFHSKLKKQQAEKVDISDDNSEWDLSSSSYVYLGNIPQVCELFEIFNYCKIFAEDSTITAPEMRFVNSPDMVDFMSEILSHKVFKDASHGRKFSVLPDVDTAHTAYFDDMTILPYKFEGVVHHQPGDFVEEIYTPVDVVKKWYHSDHSFRCLPVVNSDWISVRTIETLIMLTVNYFEITAFFKKMLSLYDKGVRYEEQVYKSCWHYKKKHSDLPFNPYCLVALMVACRVVCKYDVIARIIC